TRPPSRPGGARFPSTTGSWPRSCSMQLPLAEIAERMHGTLEGGTGGKAVGYSIDTRTLRPGELFFAIRGPRFDGHDFLAEAQRQGAVAAVVSAPAAGADAL